MKKNKIKTVSFGCRLNSLEAEMIKKLNRFSKNEILIINSCAVTNEAERQLKQFIRKNKRKNPDVKIALTGCAVGVNKKFYEDMEEVDYVIDMKEKLSKKKWKDLNKKASISTNGNVLPPIIKDIENRQRAFVQIQDGCDYNCTYCATKLARGKSFSFPKEHIIKQIKVLKKYREIVLTGVNICSYLIDQDGKKYTLIDLIKDILKETKVKRLRLSSLDIATVDDELIDLLKDKRIMPHFHFSIQSGDSEILKLMKRRHNKKQILSVIEKIQKIRPEATFGADIITGFPNEKEKHFKNSVDVVKKANITFLHVFPFSQRKGTVADVMEGQVDIPDRKKRALFLRKVGDSLMKKQLESKIGLTMEALIEGGNIARANDYTRIRFEGKEKIGSVKNLKILSVNKDNTLQGEIVK